MTNYYTYGEVPIFPHFYMHNRAYMIDVYCTCTLQNAAFLDFYKSDRYSIYKPDGNLYNWTIIYTNRTIIYTNRTVIYMNQTVIFTNRIPKFLHFSCPVCINYGSIRINLGLVRIIHGLVGINYGPVRISYGPVYINYGPVCINYSPVCINYGRAPKKHPSSSKKKNFIQNHL